ncbi:MAG TPA: hypothetical protein VFO85_06145, partial [Vicinamibacteria bacterium]|nr:hypothetical protein [Vicinamibacteria bacterium]
MEPSLDAILAAPDDDVPRLAWAKAVGGTRGELIALQCRLARGEFARQEKRQMLARERELVNAFLASWTGPGTASNAILRRGFVEEMWISIDDLLAGIDTLLEAAPLLRGLTLSGLGVDGSRFHGHSHEQLWEPQAQKLEAVLRRLPAGRIRWLTIASAGVTLSGDYDEMADTRGFGDDVALRIGRAPSLAELRSLTINASVSHTGVEALSALPLEGFRAADHRLDAGAALELVRRFPRLTRLGLSPGIVGWSLEEFLAAPETARLTELSLDCLDDADLARIASAPALARLQRLDLGNSTAVTAAGIRALAQSPHLRLRFFSVQSTRLNDISSMSGAPAFAGLTELRLDWCALDGRA